tara:strand:+ start:1100 stop:1801 length:702 start_codon:yes stop_codon:yes gene_type:complete
MYTSNVAYQVEAQNYIGHIAFPDKENFPAVIVAHAWGGRDEFADNIANKLAKLGYLGFALDMYGDGVTGTSVEENSARMQPLLDNRSQLTSRVLGAYDAVSKISGVMTSKIAICGYCFGGLVALDLARSGVNLRGSASFHGFLHDSDLPKNKISAKILAMHGMQDPMVGNDQLESFYGEMTEKNVDWQLHIYGQAMHSFTNPSANNPDFGTVYSEEADRRSWNLLKDFLREVF